VLHCEGFVALYRYDHSNIWFADQLLLWLSGWSLT